MNRLANSLGAIAIGFTASIASAQWTQETLTVGALPGGNMAYSQSTGRAYIPLMGEAALAVIEPSLATSKIALPVKAGAVAVDQAAGRILATSLYADALHLIDEASGSLRTVAVGHMPAAVRVNELTGRVYVGNWGGLEAQGSVSIVDPSTLQVTTTLVNGSTVELGLDSATGYAYVTFERPTGNPSGPMGYIGIVDAQGTVVRELRLGLRPYSLHVDSPGGRVFVTTSVTAEQYRLHVLETGTLRAINEVSFAGQRTYPAHIAFDASARRVYFGSGSSNTLHSVDADGNNANTWDLDLGTYEYSGTHLKGVHGLQVHAPSGSVYVSSPTGSLVSAFDPVTSRLERITVPGAVGFTAVAFSPDGQRVIVPDAAGENEVTVLKRAAAATHGLSRELTRIPVFKREEFR